MARLAQSAERKALNLVVVGSSPTVGVSSHTDRQSSSSISIMSSLTNFMVGSAPAQ